MLHVPGKETWKQILNFQSIDHGWDQNANICWIQEPFPKDVKEILISDEYNENEINDEEGESDNEGDTF